MAKTNNRAYAPQAFVINGADLGGAMSVSISEGYDQVSSAGGDGNNFQVNDRQSQFCRGTIVSQDFTKIISLLTGTSSSYVFYQRKSGVAASTGFIKHTLNNPKIHTVKLNLSQGDYMTISADFECEAANSTDTVKEMHLRVDAQAAPSSYTQAVRGGYRVVSCTHGTGENQLSINHVKSFSFSITMPFEKACNDGDVAYIAVDLHDDAMAASGSLSFEDLLISQSLLVAEVGPLVLRAKQSRSATDKIITIANVEFNSNDLSGNNDQGYTQEQISFYVTDDPSTPLSLDGANKVLVIADAS